MTSDEYEKFVEGQFRGSEPLISRNIKDMYIYTVGLSGEIGESLEHLKKAVRDGKFDKDKFKLEMGDALFYFTCILIANGLTISEIMEANQNKLIARNAQGYWGAKETNAVHQ